MVPNQSLTLKDIINRFIRKESLPIGREGTYNENLGDLEKIAREDIVDQKERAANIRSTLERVQKAHEAREKKKVESSTPASPASTGAATPSPTTHTQTAPSVPPPQGT